MSISAISSSLDWWEYLKTHGSSAASSAFSLTSTEEATTANSDDSVSKVTETDSATMLAMLTALSGGSQMTASVDDSGEVDRLLEKVQSGTVEDSDISAMQAALRNSPPPPPPVAEAEAETDDELQFAISDFLEKVKAGTVTDTDLTAMQTLLTADGTAAETNDAAGTDQSSVLGRQLAAASQAYESSELPLTVNLSA
ncbi:MAG: hypothetical protein E6X17_00700 [Sporomusaceae bacterium]|nr:hypothetical protein [Sporomusaceae bacterium]